MIEEYIVLLESFKEHKISKLIESVNSKILAALNSPKFNREIAVYLKNSNKKGVPFTNFDEDPDSVSQIKKLINALYYARLAFLDLENVDIREWSRSASDIRLLYGNTIHEAYQACYLLTHLDVDLKVIFSDELGILATVFTKFQAITSAVTDQTNQISETLKKYPVSYTSGVVTGTAIKQMQPTSGDIDYDFLAHFSAVLPGYIDQFTQYLSQYSSEFIEKESTLNKAKLLELQNAAYKLLTNLENLKARSFFAPLKILNYIGVIRHVITLSMSSLEQVGNLSESSQDLIRGYLSQLKYEILPTLFGLVDKIEDNSMLKPGTLSIPLMQSINPLYDWLIFYASKPVNFAAKGEELLSIEDSRFLSLRLERTYRRIDEANKSLFKIQKAEVALQNFFKILENSLYKNYTIAQLPNDVKKGLIQHYKIIRPYMDKIDVELSNTIINGLNAAEPWSAYVSTYLFKPARWVIGKQTGHLDYIKAQKATLQSLINKNRASQKLHIKLNEDLVESVQRQTDLTLFPYQGENPFIIDESKALLPCHGDVTTLAFAPNSEGSNFLLTDGKNLSKLGCEQALDLYQFYKNKHDQFIQAKNAYLQFVELLNQQKKPPLSIDGKKIELNFNQLDKDVIAECRNLYNVFQSYFVCGVNQESKEKAKKIDLYLCHLFSGKNPQEPHLTIDVFHQFDEYFQIFFTKIGLSWKNRSNFYLKEAENKFTAENEKATLSADITAVKRAHYLIQHTNYSQFVKLFRENLQPWIATLNDPMKAQLVAQTYGIPFPELERKNSVLAQPKQVIALKRIFNSLYHIEGILLALEKLNNKQIESMYVYHLLEGYGHINEIMKLTKDIASDSHFKMIGHQLFDKVQTLFAAIQEHSDGYQASHDKVLHTEQVTNNSLWYVLNTFYISPNHIRTIRNDSYTSANQQEELHRNAKRATLQIEGIIKSSSSYFKLFLQTPKMFALYTNLTNKLTEFTSTAHDSVISNLDQIKIKIFTPMLLEADHWEDKLGLQPGLLSGPLKNITDEYFKGFLTALDLKSKEHIDLYCNNKQLAARQEYAQKRVDIAKRQIHKAEKRYRIIEELYEEAQEFLFPDESYIQKIKKALPLLVQLEKTVKQEPSNNRLDRELDELVNASTNDYDPKFHNIRGLIEGSYFHYQGVRASFEMKRATSEEKLKYLKSIGDKQKEADTLFINQYVEASFDKQMEDYCNRHLGLQFVHKEYRSHLREYLLTKKKDIMVKSKVSKDINAAISDMLEEQIRLFENDHFTTYYHLDTIRIALAQFTLYFSSANIAIANGSSVFESKKTLAQKTQLINKLEEIASTGQLSIDEFIRKYTADISQLIQETNLIQAILNTAQTKKITIAALIALPKPDTNELKLITNIKNLIENTGFTIEELISQLPTRKKQISQKSDILSDLQRYASKGHLTIDESITDVKINVANSRTQKIAIKHLNELKEKVRLSIEERIEIIKTKVEPAQFKGILLTHKNPDFLSLTYLKQLFFSLLEALYLFKPARKKLYTNIKNAVLNPPEMSNLSTRLGLFSTTAKKTNEELPPVDSYKTIPA